MKYIYFILILLLTSCVEFIEDIKINLDGSGTFKYTINLSSSKTKVKSIISLDSLNGQKVPKENEVKEKIKNFKETLKEQEGINNVLITEDYENYLFKVQFDFKNVENLENGLKKTIEKLYPNKIFNHDWISYKEKTLVKSIPSFYSETVNEFIGNDIDKLKTGSYTSIVRFESTINTFKNVNSIKSKSNNALMIKVTPDMILTNENILNNVITINK